MTTLETAELLTIKEAAKLINVHPNTLRNWEKDGRLSVVRVGPRRDRRYLKSSLNAILQFAN